MKPCLKTKTFHKRGEIAQWQSVGLACVGLWVQHLVPIKKKNTKALLIPFNKTGLSVYYADNNSSDSIRCFSLLSGFLCGLFLAIVKQVLLCPPRHVLGDEVQGSRRLVPKVT